MEVEMKALRGVIGLTVAATVAAMVLVAQEPPKAALPVLDAAKMAGMRLFAGLTDAELGVMAGVWQARRYAAGTHLITKGGSFGKVVILDQGKAEVRLPNYAVIPMDKGALLGEIEYIDRLPSSADVFCTTDCVFYETDYAALDRLVQEQPRIGAAFLRNVAKVVTARLRERNEAPR
jgi:CRP-like cAMP-binding protein